MEDINETKEQQASSKESDKYYYMEEGQSKGPVTWEYICSLVKINPSVLIWRSDFTDWKTYSELQQQSTETQWYICNKEGNQEGPNSKWDITNKFMCGKIDAETPCWNSEMKEWKALQLCEELFSIVGSMSTFSWNKTKFEKPQELAKHFKLQIEKEKHIPVLLKDEPVKIVDMNWIYDSINKTNYLKWPELIDGFCMEDLKSRSGKEHWGDWCPKIGAEGIIVHTWEDKERRLVKFNDHYVVMGVPGLVSLKNDDDVEMIQSSADVAMENNDNQMETEKQKNNKKIEEEKNESNQQNEDNVEMTQSSVDVAMENNDDQMETEKQNNNKKIEEEKNKSNQQKEDNLIIPQQQNASHWGTTEDVEMSKPQAKKFSPY